MNRVRLFLCGDVMTGRGLDQVLPHPVDPELRERHVGSALTYVALAERTSGPIARPVRDDDIWGDALDEWGRMDPDVRLANLETAITRSDDFAPKGINYRMAPENAPCLRAAGLDACSLANNHALDFGRRGLVETLEVLQRLGLPAAGAGRTLAEAQAPAVIPLPGRSVRVVFAAAAFEDSGVPPDWRAGPHSPGLNLVEPSDGQPVLVGGSMGVGSYVLAGMLTSEAASFGSACHGAGRAMSRHAALARFGGRQVQDDLAARGVLVRSPSTRGLAEEAPGAYKDLHRIAEVSEKAGLASRVAHLKPLVCVKG